MKSNYLPSRGGRVGVFSFFFFFFWCVYFCIGGRSGRIGGGGRDEAERREREKGVKERIFLLFLNFFGQDMV